MDETVKLIHKLQIWYFISTVECRPAHSLVISPALKVYRGEEEEDARVGRVLPPQLHAVLLRVLVVPGLVLRVRQFRQPRNRDGDRVDAAVRRHPRGKFEFV